MAFYIPAPMNDILLSVREVPVEPQTVTRRQHSTKHCGIQLTGTIALRNAMTHHW